MNFSHFKAFFGAIFRKGLIFKKISIKFYFNSARFRPSESIFLLLYSDKEAYTEKKGSLANYSLSNQENIYCNFILEIIYAYNSE